MSPIFVTSVIILSLMSPGPDSCDCYRILGVFPLNVKSHFMMFEALMKGLARRGHQVEVVSTFPQEKPIPNYTDIINLPSSGINFLNNITYDALRSWTSITIRWFSVTAGNDLCTGLGHPDMQELIKNPPKDPPYDLVITEMFTANCYIALGHHLKIPTIGAISSALYPWHHRIIANPANLAFIPNNLIGFTPPMNFWERVYNTGNAIFNNLYFQYLTSSQNEMMKNYFGESIPTIREVETSVALVLANSHHSLHDPRPMTPALIEVGGLHIQDDGPELSENLNEWMDKSIDGFVYFTFGSMIQIESLPEKIIRIFYKSLEKIAPIRVLMKIQNPEQLPSGIPKNFYTFKWAAQLKVLQHKYVRAFITHGGLMSTQEAIHCKVPLIGVPFFCDQYTNVDLFVKKKIAVKLVFEDITEEKMDEALNAILYDPVYKNRIREFSTEFYDRPMKPMDTAIWWIEYVIRHGGKNLRSPAVDLYWWQIELFDIYAFLFFILGFFIFVVVFVAQFVLRRLFVIGNSIKVPGAKKIE